METIEDLKAQRDAYEEEIDYLEARVVELEEELGVVRQDVDDWRNEAEYWEEQCETLRAEFMQTTMNVHGMD
jgi:prefoldin subunit 5